MTGMSEGPKGVTGRREMPSLFEVSVARGDPARTAILVIEADVARAERRERLKKIGVRKVNAHSPSCLEDGSDF